MLRIKEKNYTFVIVEEDDKRATRPELGEVERFVEATLNVTAMNSFTDGRYYVVTFKRVNK